MPDFETIVSHGKEANVYGNNIQLNKLNMWHANLRNAYSNMVFKHFSQVILRNLSASDVYDVPVLKARWENLPSTWLESLN